MGLNSYCKIKNVLFYFVFFFIVIPLKLSHASWTGPLDIVVGSWGSNPGQFGFESGDTADGYPTVFGVDKDGTTVIADEINRRVQIFKADGSLLKLINKPTEINVTMWPASLIVLPEGNSFLGNLYIFNYVGDILYKVNIAKTERYGFSGGYIIKNLDNNTYYLYSPTGQFIKTSSTKPLELGIAKEQSLGGGKYRHTIQYPDITYTIISDKEYDGYFRDENKYLYLYLPGLVDKFSSCGKLLGRLLLPGNLELKGEVQPDGEQYVMMHDQYGEPVFDIHGNVYTWKKSPSKYSILKWTWVDDPNMPTGPDASTNLAVAASINGLYLTWTASPNDPGCVTGYEVSRATTAGGVATTITTVNAGTMKYNDTTATAGTTYYYKVRAKAGSEYSPYTSEVSGKR